MPRYIGVMSGTSLDSIDTALCEIDDKHNRVLATASCPFPTELRATLLRLCRSGDREIEIMGRADRQLGRAYADAVGILLNDSDTKPDTVAAIGCHGQTIRHRPTNTNESSESAFTLQIGDPNTLAAYTGIATVADFRRRDIAEGGQGAPLASGFHRAAFASDQAHRAVVNIGGMANVTLLAADGFCAGFDTGPGNVLMDAWVSKHWGLAYDDGGNIARHGQVIPELLLALLALPYFKQAGGPRSTGREDFDLAQLEALLSRHGAGHSREDVQATLLEFTAESIASALNTLSPEPDEVYICGGGAHNHTLMQRLESLLRPRTVQSTATLGVDPQWVEAMAFAWLAHRRLTDAPGNVPDVTGAKRAAILGALYPP